MANVITVTALNQYVKTILECDAVLTDIAIKGEISNFVNHFKTGHFYFSLKDKNCLVKAVMFSRDAKKLAFVPENGMNVIVRCRVSLFERDGAFQVYVDDMFPDGVGAMQLAFEQLKNRLDKEGLFTQQHKRKIPDMPKCIGIVTSKTGAAIQDIYNVTRRRNPMAHILLANVTVQGENAANGITNAIKNLNKNEEVDVIIVARGGGSKEDLWVFNDEKMARAAYESRVPVVSAIGHEIDFCILDFVADLRAPTPSAAAELVVPNVFSMYAEYMQMYKNMYKCMQRHINLCYNNLKSITTSRALINIKQLPNKMDGELKKSSEAIICA
ncbi:MAG: exodeoxyribonuclease VII large subunit, partial [Oscillospiraceae bacterium]